jgi:Response regulators consisting of a CheY-like receiver domain and a winged-helix DNA-binding domain
MEKVLIVEDDAGIMGFLKTELCHEGFEVRDASDGRTAMTAFESSAPDIVLLDIMLPELSGLEVLRRIRKTSSVPVILLTARGETYDKVNGLNAGADDYLTKPFEIEELLARMRAVMRRQPGALPVLKIRNLELHTDRMEAVLNGRVVELSRTEFFLLRTLMENRNTVLSRDQLISSVWGQGHYIDENSVDVYVRYIRQKIDEQAGEEYITTVRGFGYTMKDDVK